MIKKGFLIVTFLLTFSFSETVYIKYKGTVDVDNGHFSHLELKNSSLVKDMYYDKNNEYLLVRLKHTYYHYCSIPSNVINSWVGSPSLGRYYNTYIKGNYDCRIYPVPNY